MRKAGPGRLPWIEGTKASLKTSQLLLSTGCAPLDSLLGGGLPLGSLLIIDRWSETARQKWNISEEDETDSYTSSLCRQFVAEGVTCSHSLFVASEDPETFLRVCSDSFEMNFYPVGPFQELPGPVIDEKGGVQDRLLDNSMDPELKIAFRYENLPKIDGTLHQKSSPLLISAHTFDLAGAMPAETVEKIQKFTVELPSSDDSMGSVISELHSTLASNPAFAPEPAGKKEALRILLKGAGSSLWAEGVPVKPLCDSHGHCSCAYSAHQNSRFFQSQEVKGRIRRIADAAIRLESFVGSEKETNPTLSDYHGLLHILQLPRINVIQPVVPDCFDLAFKLKRRGFTIQKLHLPPDLAENPDSSNSTAVMGCAAGLAKSKLDF